MFRLLFDSDKICLFCLENKEDLKNYICPICRDNIEDSHRQLGIILHNVDKAYSSVYYNRFIKGLLHDFKFNDKSYLYKALSEILIETIRINDLDKEIDLIYYVPLHRRKKARRGYNQSELLASYISRSLSLEISHDLKKIKSTKDQHRLTKIERQTNLNGSFKVKKEEDLVGKRALLIDDLITTGSTLDECARLLKEAGASRVIGLCLASGRA